jgi:hypothetical protein
MVARIVARVGAGDDPRVATAEETRRALAELDAAAIALERAFDELPCLPAPPKKSARKQ